MLNVVICEDNEVMLSKILDIVDKEILMSDFDDIKLELSTTNQYDVLNLFVDLEFEKDPNDPNGLKKIIKRKERKPLKQRLLFLDINFEDNGPHYDGVQLANEIRSYDILSHIVFITNSGVEHRDVVEQKIAPLGYIQKWKSEEQVLAEIKGAFIEAHNRSHMSTVDRRMIEFKSHRRKFYHKLDEICYIKGSASNKEEGLCALHLDNKIEPLSHPLKYYSTNIPELIKLGRSHIINPAKVRGTKISAKWVKLEMANRGTIRVERKSYEDYKELLVSYATKNF